MRSETESRSCTAVLALDQRGRERDISKLNNTRNDAEYRVLLILGETQRVHSTAYFIEISRIIRALYVAAAGMSKVAVVPMEGFSTMI